ncbi:MAG: hypothetical protein KA765_10360 [Thermoflexales bacterium]|nr:hypothetical protein [Thermoflexales bacterium]
MSLRKNIKFWFGVLIGVWVLVIFASLGQQTVSAQSRVYDLKPPFKFVQTSEPNRPLIGQPPLGSKVIMTETFGPSFKPVASLVGDVPQWRIVRDTLDTAGYYWGRVSDAAPITFTNSAWTAISPTVLAPGDSNYPAGQDTWLIYGPLDLSRYQYGTLKFQYYLDADDTLIWGAFTDPSQVFGTSISNVHHNDWVTGTLSFNHDSYGNNAVYLAFGFQSQTSNGLGAFIRNVQFNAEPIHYVFLPIVGLNFPPTPTPTPTATPIPPLFGYTFDAGNTDLAAWGGRFDGTSGSGSGTFGYGQCLPGNCLHTTSLHGNPANSLRLYSTAYWFMVGASPNTSTPANYELQLDVSPVMLYPRDKSCGESCPGDNLGNWYGVIFNASSDTFGTTPAQFNYYAQSYYRFYFYNVDAVMPIGMRLDRCSGGSCVKLGSSSIPAGLLSGLNLWDHIRIRRVGSLIEVYVNNVLALSRTDATLMSGGEFGVFTFPSDGNAVQYPPTGYEQQVDFDNIKVYNP